MIKKSPKSLVVSGIIRIFANETYQYNKTHGYRN